MQNNYHLPPRTFTRNTSTECATYSMPPNRQSRTPPPLSHRTRAQEVSSEELIGPAREVLIRHAGCDYRLRITRQGKLILTK